MIFGTPAGLTEQCDVEVIGLEDAVSRAQTDPWLGRQKAT
jgi:hypothetical protein